MPVTPASHVTQVRSVPTVQLQVLLQALQPLLKLPAHPHTNGTAEEDGEEDGEPSGQDEISAEVCARTSARGVAPGWVRGVRLVGSARVPTAAGLARRRASARLRRPCCSST